MRVLFLISQLDGRGGAGRSVAEMVLGLHEAGVHTEVVCFQRTPTGLESHLEREGIPVYVLDAHHLADATWRLRCLLRERHPDILHTTMYAADQAGRFAAWRTGIPVVSSIVNPTHDTALLVDDTCPLWRRRLMWALDGWTARHLTTRIHAITEAVGESVVRGLRVPADRVSVVYRSRDPARLGEPDEPRSRAIRKNLGLDEDAVIVLTVGRQTKQKGHLHLVDAFTRVAATHDNAILLLAGTPGDSTPAIEARVHDYGLEGRVQLLGHREDIGDLLAAADVFAFPSVYEGLGAALIEAMALATPIVASDIPAIREVTGNGEVALLVPPGDSRALGTALERVLDDPVLRARLAADGRARYLEHFTPERITASLLEMYRGVLDESG